MKDGKALSVYILKDDGKAGPKIHFKDVIAQAKKLVDDDIWDREGTFPAPDSKECPEDCECIHTKVECSEWKKFTITKRFKFGAQKYIAVASLERQICQNYGVCACADGDDEEIHEVQPE